MKVMEEGERTILGLMVASVRSSQFWLPSTYVWNRDAGPHADVRVRNANVGATGSCVHIKNWPTGAGKLMDSTKRNRSLPP